MAKKILKPTKKLKKYEDGGMAGKGVTALHMATKTNTSRATNKKGTKTTVNTGGGNGTQIKVRTKSGKTFYKAK